MGLDSPETLQLYNTLTDRKEPFEPVFGDEVRMYVCGPTVYDVCHLGHGRSYVVFDVLARYLRWLGYRVRLVINFTDVEERITEKAEGIGMDPLEFADGKISEFFEVMDGLGIKRADEYPRVSAYVPQMIDVVGRLMELGYAYPLGKKIFLDVAKAGRYGDLLHANPEEALVDDRQIENMEPGRRSTFDFEIWDGTVTKDPIWDSPWGPGRIGWHVECYVMSRVLAHPQDIKGGGLDLIFPHHESTKLVASALGEELSRFYVHNAFMTFNERKMSKSRGVYVPIKEAMEEFSPGSLRYFILSTHYRKNLDYSRKAIRSSEQKLDLVRRSAKRLLTVKQPTGPDDGRLLEAAESLRTSFHPSMRDDLDTPAALDALVQFARASEGLDVGQRSAEVAREMVTEAGGILGFDW
jgi:cysteinyl-tRNA synthetase